MSGSRSRSRRLRRWRGHGEKAACACSGCPSRFGTPDNGATETTARPTRMVSNDPIKDYMRRHACSFPEALEALAAQLGPPPPTTSDAPCRRWAGPGRQWIYLRRWKPGATARSRRRDRPHRLGLTTGRRRPLVLRLVLQVVTPPAITDFSAGYPPFKEEGAVSWQGSSGRLCRKRIAIPINLIRLRATGTKSPVARSV
jgi:hypothetical protein